MEWIELLKMLSDQQTNAITQRQIEVLQGQIVELAKLVRFQSVALGIILVVILVFDFYFHLWYKTSTENRIKKLESSISRLNSIKNKNGLLVEK